MKLDIMNKITRLAASAAGTLLLIAGGCGEKEFKIKGCVADSDGDKVLLEKADFSGYWTIVDSTRTDKKGNFKFSQPQQSGPEIFRLSMDDRFIYLPIDSVETLKVETSRSGFGHDFTVSGTEQAANMAKFEKELIALAPYYDNADSLDKFKRHVYAEYLQDARGSIISYYILTKTIGNKTLYNPTTNDYRYFQAIANSYNQFKPDDARTPLLLNLAAAARRNRNEANGVTRVIEAEEVKVIDIALDDENGKTRKLSEMVGKGKPVVVAFTMMRDGVTPEINRQLAELYNAGRIDIYNVSPDRDQYGWKTAAGNLPWVTVLDPSAGQDNVFLRYNVTEIPTFFLYNAAGELTARASTVKELRRQL